MFTDFLYLLRAYGLPVGLVEWTALMDGLRLGLERESLMEFYHMARAILVKRENLPKTGIEGRKTKPLQLISRGWQIMRTYRKRWNGGFPTPSPYRIPILRRPASYGKTRALRRFGKS